MTHFIFSNILLIVLLLVYFILKKDTKQFKINRWYLFLGPILVLIIPYLQIDFLERVVPVVELPIISSLSDGNSIETSSYSFSMIFYSIGCIFSLVYLAFKLLKIYRLPTSDVLSQIDGVKIVQSPFNYSFSFGKTIFIHSTDEFNTELIVLHEVAHCKQNHSIDIIWINLFKVIFWFNPFIYFWEKAIKENHEFLADEYVIRHHEDTKEYMTTLVEANYNGSFPHLATGFNSPSLLKKRIQKMKNQNNNKMKHLILIPVVITGTLLFTSMDNKISISSPLQTVQEVSDVIQPTYKGGMEAMIQFIQSNLTYPKNIADREGKVIVSFIVRANGKVEEVSVVKSSTFEEFDQEAMRIVSLMPDWEPGTSNGKVIDVEMKLPIMFTNN